jgi:hypothetical protein
VCRARCAAADDQYFKELRAQHRRLRFLPAMLRTITFAGAPSGKPILVAIDYFRSVIDDQPRPGPAPTAFVPAWSPQVRDETGTLDLTVCLLDRIRAAIRRRDIFVSPSFRYADPGKGRWTEPPGTRRGQLCAGPSRCVQQCQ